MDKNKVDKSIIDLKKSVDDVKEILDCAIDNWTKDAPLSNVCSLKDSLIHSRKKIDDLIAKCAILEFELRVCRNDDEPVRNTVKEYADKVEHALANSFIGGRHWVEVFVDEVKCGNEVWIEYDIQDDCINVDTENLKHREGFMLIECHDPWSIDCSEDCGNCISRENHWSENDEPYDARVIENCYVNHLIEHYKNYNVEEWVIHDNLCNFPEYPY